MAQNSTDRNENTTEIAVRIRAAGERAKAEADARRAARAATDARPKEIAKEIGGPAAPDPTRYGDWERKGLISDF